MQLHIIKTLRINKMKNNSSFLISCAVGLLLSTLFVSYSISAAHIQNLQQIETARSTTINNHTRLDKSSLRDEFGYKVTNQKLGRGELQTHIYKTKPGVNYQIKYGFDPLTKNGIVGLNAKISSDNVLDKNDADISGSTLRNIDVDIYNGEFIIVTVSSIGGDTKYWLEIVDTHTPTEISAK
jgi:hypothetical protein